MRAMVSATLGFSVRIAIIMNGLKTAPRSISGERSVNEWSAVSGFHADDFDQRFRTLTHELQRGVHDDIRA